MKLRKVRMSVSIASATWAFQPGMVVEVPADQAAAWLRSGLATLVSQDVPVTKGDDLLADLSAEAALRHRCVSCDRRRAKFVLRNKPYCPACFKAALES